MKKNSNKRKTIKIHKPNKETIEAIKEAERLLNDPNTKKYTFEEAIKELKK